MVSETLPSVMRAWTFNSAGTPDKVLRFNQAYPIPSPPTASDVLIRISYVALSSANTNLMIALPSLLRRNAIPEIDFSGVIAQAGPTAPLELEPGTAVFGTIPVLSSVLYSGGALAEYVVVPSANVNVKPTGVGLAEAAGLTSLPQTALELIEKSGVKAGDRVLVHGGGGDIGSVVVQIAVAAGATVVATCSESKSSMVLGFGAAKVIDYRANIPLHSFLVKEYGQQAFDIIMDTVGSQDLYNNSPGYLQPRGVYANVGNIRISTALTLWRRFINSCWPTLLGGVPRTYIMFSTIPDKIRGAKIAELAQENKVKVLLDSTFKMEDALLGYQRMHDGNRNGRCLIEVCP